MQGCRWFLLSAFFFPCVGCFSLDKPKPQAWPVKPPQGPAAQVVVNWRHELAATQNPMANGRLLPGIAGRVYLLGPDLNKDGQPREAQGKNSRLLVEMNYVGANNRPMQIKWEFSKATHLDNMLKRDSQLGWGYTVFLPWAEYDPSVNAVELLVTYVPEKGYPLFAAPTRMNLQQQRTQVRATSRQGLLQNSTAQADSGLATLERPN